MRRVDLYPQILSVGHYDLKKICDQAVQKADMSRPRRKKKRHFGIIHIESLNYYVMFFFSVLKYFIDLYGKLLDNCANSK